MGPEKWSFKPVGLLLGWTQKEIQIAILEKFLWTPGEGAPNASYHFNFNNAKKRKNTSERVFAHAVTKLEVYYFLMNYKIQFPLFRTPCLKNYV